jgi:hypothetical protein
MSVLKPGRDLRQIEHNLQFSSRSIAISSLLQLDAASQPQKIVASYE